MALPQSLYDFVHHFDPHEGSLFRHFADAVSDVVWFTEAHPEKVLYVSPAFEKIWGHSANELYLHPKLWLQAIVPEDLPQVERAFSRWISGQEKNYSVEYRIQQPGGAERWIFDRGAFVLKGNDGCMRMGGIAEDITERKLLEQERIELLTQLQQALHFRNEFISMASHELRTPLTPLKLSLLTLQILNRPGGPGVEREKNLEKMLAIALEQVRRLETLTSNLLDVSKIQSERFQITRAELNLSELLEILLAAHRHWAETSGCELRGHIEPGVVGDFDRMRVEQVVVNLLSNAMKYAPGAPIDVSLVRLDGHAAISVRDHGPGIGSSFLPKVFEPFSRDSKVRGSTGLGLGLYICRRIAEAHGGIIQAKNAEGGGAQFILTLPVRERMQAAA